MAKKTAQIADQYAQAILDLAKQEDNLNEVLADLQALRQVIKDEPNLLVWLSSHEVDPDVQDSLIQTLSKDAVSSVQNLVKLLSVNQRFNIMDLVIDRFIELYNLDQGIVDVKITTAIDLDDQEKAGLEKVFLAKSGAKKLNSSYLVDTAIIGGVIMQSSSILIDGSLRTKIARLQAQLLG
ncbi:ATP synthase F1 subunit delta [Eupransor demetentiae]|uniref:ATP synthase subunit delta n=1 Tax=Eupransor demetentiae TaxID=3109584 RepID=A0ABP0ETA6_9LACO|nr:FoF1-type ATP synthase [Lactobacillaceae bacterium LMG 33000]